MPERRDSAIEDRKKVAGREQKAVALVEEAIVLIKPVHHHALPTLLNRVEKAANMASTGKADQAETTTEDENE